MEYVTIMLVTILFLIFLMWFFWKEWKNLPPGPRGLPIVGYAPFLGKSPYLTLTALSETYGNVITVPLGMQYIVVLNDWKSIKEALVQQGDCFSDRPFNTIIEEIVENADIIVANGHGWKERRRFTLQHLRDFGFGKKSMETVITDEVEKLIGRFKLNPTTDIIGIFFFSFMNIIWSIVGAKSYEPNDSYMRKFIDTLDAQFSEFASSKLIMFLPIVRYIPGIPSINAERGFKAVKDLYEFLDKEIDEHIKTYQEGNNRDFVDVYLGEIFKHEKLNMKTESFTRKNLRVVMMNLFNAGIETGSTTLSWALLYMATWPEIQEKVQQELDDVIGRERLPSYADKSRLPYTEATVLEIHRYASIVALSVPHSPKFDTKLFEYNIPKGITVIENIWAVHHDPKLWGDPEIFRPERFLNANGEVQKPEYLIPFSVGSRFCLGEPLARMEVFIFFSSLLHTFTFSRVTGLQPPKLEPIARTTLVPPPFKLKITQR